MKCCSTGDVRCGETATHKVEKKDLSHRSVEYCGFHAAPYKRYPSEFIVTQMLNSTNVQNNISSYNPAVH